MNIVHGYCCTSVPINPDFLLRVPKLGTVFPSIINSGDSIIIENLTVTILVPDLNPKEQVSLKMEVTSSLSFEVVLLKENIGHRWDRHLRCKNVILFELRVIVEPTDSLPKFVKEPLLFLVCGNS
jgi:hypothetical protein